MEKETFKQTATAAVLNLIGEDGEIKRVEWFNNEADFYVLEGGYEPARIRAYLSNEQVCLGYK